MVKLFCPPDDPPASDLADGPTFAAGELVETTRELLGPDGVIPAGTRYRVTSGPYRDAAGPFYRVADGADDCYTIALADIRPVIAPDRPAWLRRLFRRR